jgi:hypothetical protein
MYPPRRREGAESRSGGIATTRGRRSRSLTDSLIVLPHSPLPYRQWVEQHWAVTCLIQVHHWCPGSLVAPTTSSAVPLISSVCPACICEGLCGLPRMPQSSVGGQKCTPPPFEVHTSSIHPSILGESTPWFGPCLGLLFFAM